MIKQITGTVASRLVIVAQGLLLTMVAGHRLGTAGLGTIGLVVLGIALVGLLANLLGGGAMVYLAPRVPLRKLLPPAYGWALLAGVIGGVLLDRAELVPPGYALHTAVLAVLLAGTQIHLGVLIGQERIRTHNQLTVIQALVLLLVFTAGVLRPYPDPMAYVVAAYVAYGITLVLSIIALRTSRPPALPPPTDPMRLLVRQGLLVQGANALQLLSHRLAYWLIERARGTAALGLYSVATQLAEGAWLAPKSLGMVLYSRMSNTDDRERQRLLTIGFLQLSVGCALLVVVLLLLLPAAAFSLAFGPQVQGLAPLIGWLAPGILAIAAAQALSHFFSGTARNVHNVISSGIGVAITIGLTPWALAHHGLVGAAGAASCAYIGQCTYQLIAFLRITRTGPLQLLPRVQDMHRLRALFQGNVPR